MKINSKLIRKILIIALTSIFSLILIALITSFFFLNSFAKKINQKPFSLITTTLQAWKSNEFENKNNLNFIILGLDKRDDQLEKTITTDTIIFSSINFSNQKLTLISLPRDIWNYELDTKINNIYPLALEENKDTFSFIQDNFSKLTGQNIDKTIIITTDNLITFVNDIGGVDVYMEKDYKDTKYPNPDYIKNPSPNIPIYKTVEFKAGPFHLDQSNVTEFVRSRKGAETAAQGGTDIGRIQRQQLLIDAIMTKIKSKEFLSDYSNLIKLYNFWHSQISTNLNDQDLINLVLKMRHSYQNINLNKITIPIGNTPKDGVIYHPDNFINKQWVFTTSDQNYSQLQQFIKTSIN